jgi:probable addiction module antidote protein
MAMDNKPPFDPVQHLRTEEDITRFLTRAFASRDRGMIAYAIGVVMRVRGPTQIARETGLSREQLYRSLSEFGNPTLKTILAVLKALGVDMAAVTPRVIEPVRSERVD